MKNRLVAIVLTVILVLNNGAALAHPTHGSAVPEVHTVRFGVMEGDEQLLPLERRGTSLVGQGGDFVNAQGEVNTRIEGVYYQNGTLVSASRGDTGFSLSPLMLEEYFLATPEPTPTPTPSPTPSMTPTPSPAPSASATPSQEPTVMPSATPAPSSEPEPSASASVTPFPPSPTPGESSVPSASPDPAGTPAPSVTPAPSSTAEPPPSPEVSVEPSTTSEPSAEPASPTAEPDSGTGEETTPEPAPEITEDSGEQPVSPPSAMPDDTPPPAPEPAPQPEAPTEAKPEPPAEPQSPEPENPQESPEAIGAKLLHLAFGITAAAAEEQLSPAPQEASDPPAAEEPENAGSPAADPPPPHEPPAENPPADPIDKPVQDEPAAETPPADPTAEPAQEPPPAENPPADPTQEPPQESPVVPAETPGASSQPPAGATTEPLPAATETPSAPLTEPSPSPCATQQPTPEPRIRPESIPAQPISQMRSANGGASSVAFPGLFDEVTDVHLTAFTTGFKEDIVVGAFTGNHVYAYELHTSGLTASLSGQEILLSDAQGNMLAKLEAPNMTDASGRYSTNIAVSISGGGGSYRLTYTPDAEWMAQAAYPVVIDPSGHYYNDLATGIGDVYVSASQPDRHFDHTVPQGSAQRDHDREGTNLYAGNGYIAYILPSLTGFAGGDSGVSEFPTTSGLMILNAQWDVYVHEGGGTFQVSLVTSRWNTPTITYNTRPSLSSEITQTITLHTGWNTVDLTRIFSAWFNTSDQKENFGFAITSDTSWARICSSDVLPRADRMSFSADYTDDLPAPTVTATAYGYGVNSESGYIDLSWNAVPLAAGYRLGIYNGSEYQYLDIGNVTSYSTRGKALWPTDAEMAAGNYTIHWNGGGQELPNIPRMDQSDLNYYFTVQPANAYGQTGSTFGRANAVLPDTTPPNKPVTVSVSPVDWTSASAHTVTWAGVTDLPTHASTLGVGGQIQYAVNPSSVQDPAAWNWQSTGSNSANGSFTLQTGALADGTHTVYLRGVDANGNYGAPAGAQFKVDRTPPAAPQVTILPDSWTKEATASLTWTGIADLNDLLRVEYAVDGGTYTDTKLTDKTFSGFEIDISALADGEHTVAVRGVDIAGNVGAEGRATLFIDRSAPTVETVTLEPSVWADTEQVKLLWEGAADPYSGLAAMSYAVDQGAETPLPAAGSGEQTIDVSTLPDGEHTVTLYLTDALENRASQTLTFLIDRTAPEAAVLSPQDGAVVTGVLDIWGTAADLSLKDWTLTAVGSSGKTVTVREDSVGKNAEQLGVLDTGEFADGETIEIVLTVNDQAGHTSTARGVYIKADHSTRPLTGEITITAPTQGEVVTTAYKEASYTTDYAGYEDDNRYILDGQPAGVASHLKFPLHPILYPEGSLHSLSVISEDRGGVVHYTPGMATVLILSDIWKDESKIASADGLTLSQMGAEVTGGSGTLVSRPFSAPRPVLAIRLHTVESLAPGGSISYEYSVDGGASWHGIREGHDVYFDAPQTSVAVRASLSGSGTTLHGLDITGVYEMNPLRFQVRLLRPVTAFGLTGGEYTVALPTVTTDSAAALTTQRLYVDGEWNSNSFTADLLPFEDDSAHTVTALGLDGEGRLHASGASASILLRTTLNATDLYETGRLELPGDTYAIRFETLCLNLRGNAVESGRYAYSCDGATWTDCAPGGYVLLPRATRLLYLRATLPAGVALRALHLEGVTAQGTGLSTRLIKAPYNVQAADWGGYYENEKLRRYVLTWSDPNRDDPTCANEVWFDIYRNGEKIASTRQTRYEDFDYQENAVYHVRARREYSAPGDGLAHILTRASGRVRAAVTVIPAEERIEGVVHNVADFTQSEYLNDLYGGNYTFSTEANPPSVSFALDESLLGPHRFCSLGFEPVNFNTGNFFLQTADFSLPDLGTSALEIVRTYNTQSSENDGPFGAKWATEYSQHLRLFNDGSVGYRRADGSEIIFYHQPDGTFVSNSTEYEALSYDLAHTEYRITLTDGTMYAFASGGLLKRIERDGGQHQTHLMRDEDGLLIKILSPSQEELLVEMDENGHIVKLTLPGGGELNYRYSGNNLVSFTDQNGAETRYQYDGKGRMTAWYDANGKRQVLNRYDSQDRVTAQTDAAGGRYRMEYADGHTVTTDAEGNTVTYYYDERKRTTRIVDALGGETAFTYGENGEIVSETDPMGNVTTYAYNAAGDLTATVLPNGGSILREYDANHNLTRLQDLNGGVTTYAYDENGNLTAETAPDGGVTRYAYDHKGRMVEKTDALGGVTRYEYVNGQLVKTIDPLGNETGYAYDASGNMTALTDALGHVTLLAYDAKGNLLRQTFADGTAVSYTYDGLGNRTSMTDPLGNVTRYKYDAMGRLTETVFPDKTTQKTAYTRNGQVSRTTDALGNRTTYTYDPNGNQITQTDPQGNVTTRAYDPAGNLLAETNALGGVTEYTYDALGLPLTVTDPAGIAQSMAYDLAGNLTRRSLPGGGKIRVEYDRMGRPVRQVNALGGVTELAYDLLGRLIRVTDPVGAQTAYTYDACGNLLTATDALGNVTAWAYDALGRVVSETAPDGAVTRYAYDSVGSLVYTLDAYGGMTRYGYDENGNLTGLTDALGQTVALGYDKNGRATTAVQKNGGVLATGYDRAGRVTSETDANGHTTAYRYDKNGLVTQITDAQGQKAQFAYDALGNVTKITAPGKAVTLYEYDGAGRTLSMTDAEGCVTAYGYNEAGQIAWSSVNGNATQYEYDAAGNVTAVTDAEGRRVTFAYDLAGRMTETVYPDGSKDTTEYDLLGRVVKTTPRTGLATAYEYDAMGNVLSVTQGDRVTRYEYDLLGRLVKQTAPDGAETAYTYDALGNLTGETDPLGNETRFAYTAESLLEKVTYANGAEQRLTYDLAGNVIAETDAEGNTKQYQYDRVNRLTGVTDELGNKTAYAYDAQDNIVKVTDALKHVTRYTYDQNGNLLTETDALGNRVTYAYTPEGWLESVTKADGTVLAFAYDRTGSLLIQNVGDGQTVESSYNDIGMVTEVSGAEGSITYQYDERGYLLSVENVNGDVVSYTYDEYGNKTSMTYPDGRVVSYTYDRMNRMTGVTGLDGEVTTYTYDAAGRRTKTSGNTLTTSYRYDSVGNLVEQVTHGESEIAFSYAYDRNGYLTGEIRRENGTTVASSYAYDAAGQLTEFLQTTGYGERYAYDKAGNMTEKVLTGTDGAETTLAMKYNKGNQLTSMANGRDKIAYTYDRNGSMVQKVLSSRSYGKLTDSYAYNALNQLTEYVGYDGYRQAFTYDANGMRQSKSEAGDANRSTLEELLRGNVAGLPEIVEPAQSQTNADEADVPAGLEWATTEYLYDLTQEYYQVISETTTYANGTSATTAYAYGLERIAAYSENGVTRYVYDGRGSVAQAISAPVAGEAAASALPDVGVQVQTFSYTAYGEQMGSVKAGGFTYNAEAYDAATGMLNLRARQYEPALNRFSQKDIYPANLLIPQSFNAYLFTYNSPVSFVDGDGLSAKSLGSVLSSIGSKVQKVVSGIGNAVKTVATAIFGEKVVNTVVSGVKSVARTIRKAAQPIVDTVSTAWNKATQMYREAQEEISRLDKTAPDYHLQVDAIYRSACARYMGVEEETSAAKWDEKKQQIYELEQRLSDADRAAGIRVIEVDGGLYYDYTTLFKSKLDEYLDLMAGAQLSDATAAYYKDVVEVLTTQNSAEKERIFQKYSHGEANVQILESFVTLSAFMVSVQDNAPWDVKSQKGWEDLVGNEIYKPQYGNGNNEVFYFNGTLVDREQLGNITYGYLGTALNIPDELLYLGGGMAKQGVIDSARKLLKGDNISFQAPTYGDDSEDIEYVRIGIEMFHK